MSACFLCKLGSVLEFSEGFIDPREKEKKALHFFEKFFLNFFFDLLPLKGLHNTA